MTNSMIDLADQLEGQSGCPIGKGEPTLDQDGTSTWFKRLLHPERALRHLLRRTPTQDSGTAFEGSPSDDFLAVKCVMRLWRFSKKIDQDEGDPEHDWAAMQLQEAMGEDSVDEEDEDAMTSFSNPMSSGSSTPEQSVLVSSPGSAVPDSKEFMEIYAQEYKARQRVREIKKMRQYFQKGKGGGKGGRDPAAQRWIEEQQKTEPCFLCHKLGHWSQECPYRTSKTVRSALYQCHVPGRGFTADRMGSARRDGRWSGIHGACSFNSQPVFHTLRSQPLW